MKLETWKEKVWVPSAWSPVTLKVWHFLYAITVWREIGSVDDLGKCLLVAILPAVGAIIGVILLRLVITYLIVV